MEQISELAQQVWSGLSTQIGVYGPKVIAAAAILLGTLLIAFVVKSIIAAAINRTGFARQANETTGGSQNLGSSLASAAFWVIILIGLVQALTRLELTAVVDPLNQMLTTILDYLPRIMGAILLFGIFWIVASVVRQTAKAVLVFADPLPEKLGLTTGPANIAAPAAAILSGLMLLIGGIAALDVLDIEAISTPAIGLLTEITNAIPNVIVAALIVTVFVFIGRFVSGLLKRTLPGTGVDSAIAELGILKGADRGLTATDVLANLSVFFIVLLGLVAGLRALGFEALTTAMDTVLDMSASIAFGAVIIFAGVFVSRIISRAMTSTGDGATDFAANFVRWTIVVLAAILGISRMGLDPSGGMFILDAARILLIGAAAGLAIAFGWGGKDWAAKQLQRLRSTDR